MLYDTQQVKQKAFKLEKLRTIFSLISEIVQN